MQPRRHHLMNISMFPVRRLYLINSRASASQWSFPGTLSAMSWKDFRRCSTRNWHYSTCTIRLQQRTFSTTTLAPEETSAGAAKQPSLSQTDHTQPFIPSKIFVSKSPTRSNSKRNHPTRQQSMLPLAQQVRAVMRDVPIGQLSDGDIKSILTEVFENCRVSSRVAGTIYANITYAEQLVHRLVQEVNHRHLDRIVVSQDTNHDSALLQTSHVIRSLGTVWHYIILGSSHLPVILDRRQESRNQGKSESSHAVNEQPFIVTGRLLMKMLQLHHQHPSIHPPPTPTLYNAWLYSCYTSSSVTDDALYTAEAILRNLEGNKYSGEDAASSSQINKSSFDILPPPANVPNPTKGMYNHILLIHADRAETVYGAAVQAEDMLMRMTKAGVHPSTSTFNRVLKAWAVSPEKEGGNRAADVLHLMLTLCDDVSTISHGNEIAPDEISFGTVISAFVKRQQPEACQLILEEAIAYFASDIERSRRLSALSDCWNTAFFGWAKSGRSDAPERLEALMNDGIVIHEQRFKVVPTKSTYVACIEAHLKSGRPDRIDNAERYLNIMVETMRRAKREGIQGNLNVESVVATTREYDTLINAWFRSLEEFENIGINKETGTYPIGYTSTRASNLLQQMLYLQEEGFACCIPRPGTFYMCIQSLCQTAGACLSASKKIKKVLSKPNDENSSNESAQLAQEYKSSMKKHAMVAADKALEILAIAEARRLSTDACYAALIHLLCRINKPVYTLKAINVLDRYEQAADERNLQWQESKVWMYNTIIAGLNAIGTLQAAESALAILRRIPKSGKRAIDKNGIWIYTGVLCIFSKNPGERSCAVAIELFKDLLSGPIHTQGSNNSIDVDFCERVLWILAGSRNEQAAGDACDILNSILERHAAKELNFEPSMSCFNACIQALTWIRDLKHTRSSVRLLQEIIGKYESGEISQLPSRAAFDLVIQNCNEEGSDEMIQHASEIALLAEKYAIGKNEDAREEIDKKADVMQEMNNETEVHDKMDKNADVEQQIDKI